LSIQDSINEVKKEFSNDEQMLASAFKLEKFYKKHKIKIFSVVAIAVLFFGGKAVMKVMKQNRLNRANQAYLELGKNPNSITAKASLKENNPALFELYNYKKAVEAKDVEMLKTLSSSKNSILADMSSYHLGLIEKKSVDSELYNEMALVNSAYLLIKHGKVSEAKNQLELINESSPVYNISKIMKHYSIKGQ
jgi:hypothetical protein